MWLTLIGNHQYAVVRPADRGLSDLEFELGARFIAEGNSHHKLIKHARNQELLTQAEWGELIREYAQY